MSSILSPEEVAGMLARKLREAGIPPRYNPAIYDPELDPLCAPMLDSAGRWADSWSPGQSGLWLHGPVGCGKTLLACWILSHITESHIGAGRGPRLCWVNAAGLMADIRATFNPHAERTEQDLVEDLIDADLLVIDDLGAERPNDWVLERLYTIINGLYEAGGSLIVTSNLTGKALQERIATEKTADIAERLVSRLWGMVEPLGGFPARDFRRAK